MEIQKYYVMKNEEPILVKDFINDGEIVETQGLKISEIFDSIRTDYHLTEQEIRDYDEAYMEHAVPVRKGWND